MVQGVPVSKEWFYLQWQLPSVYQILWALNILKDYAHEKYFSRKWSILKNYWQCFHVQSLKERLHYLPFFLQYPEPPCAFLGEINTEPGPPGHLVSLQCCWQVRAAGTLSIQTGPSRSDRKKSQQNRERFAFKSKPDNTFSSWLQSQREFRTWTPHLHFSRLNHYLCEQETRPQYYIAKSGWWWAASILTHVWAQAGFTTCLSTSPPPLLIQEGSCTDLGNMWHKASLPAAQWSECSS